VIDSVVGSARSVIVDFSARQNDLIDLSAIDADSRRSGDQRFDFIGAGAFTKDAGQLRAFTSNDLTIVEGDVDGNGRADFQIALDGIVRLSDGDFLL
jgi:hypothetical protein